MKKLILFFVIACIANPVSAQTTEPITQQKSVYFATAKHVITPESEAILNDILPLLQQFDTYELTIQGNTDDKGNNKYNQALSERRANAVKTYLQTRGIDAAKLRIAAYGEEKPIADNTEDEGKQKNRRVDIYIAGTKKAVEKAVVKKDAPKSVVEAKPEEPQGDINDLYRLLAGKPQEFEFDPRQNEVFVGVQGTIIYYQANSVQTACSKVKMRLKEVYKKSDMILERLTTQTTSGEMLTTGGMVKTEIIDCDGKNLKLKAKQQILIVMPSPTPIDARMKLFNGQIHTSKNPYQDSTIFWNLAEGSLASSRGGRNCQTDCVKPKLKQIIIGIFSRNQYFLNRRNRICVANNKLETKRMPFKKETMRLDLKRRLQQKALTEQDSIKQLGADTKNEAILVDIIRNKKMIDTLKTTLG